MEGGGLQSALHIFTHVFTPLTALRRRPPPPCTEVQWHKYDKAAPFDYFSSREILLRMGRAHMAPVRFTVRSPVCSTIKISGYIHNSRQLPEHKQTEVRDPRGQTLPLSHAKLPPRVWTSLTKTCFLLLFLTCPLLCGLLHIWILTPEYFIHPRGGIVVLQQGVQTNNDTRAYMWIREKKNTPYLHYLQ